MCKNGLFQNFTYGGFLEKKFIQKIIYVIAYDLEL